MIAKFITFTRLVVRRPARAAAALGCALAVLMQPHAAAADIVTNWNQITFSTGGPQIQRTLAMVHLAMFDAVNAVSHHYTPYRWTLGAAAGTSAEAAAAAAAHGILVRLFPAQQVALDAALIASVAGIPNGAAKAAGLALGDQVAADLFAARSTDNILAPNPVYVPLIGAGFYQLTPPNFAAPVNVAAGTWVPFGLTDAGQFRPNGSLSTTHPKYAEDFEEVRQLGAATGSIRTADQTLSALWSIEQTIPATNRFARQQSAVAGLGLLDNARLFALLNMALADAVTSVFDAKYGFNSWRPVTAIREAASDGNPKTTAVPAWLPFLTTPPHPEYPAAHAVTANGAVQVLESVFGQNYHFAATSASVPGVVREFDSFKAYAEDCGLARIYGGIHFRTAVEEGARQGRKVGNWIVENFLTASR